MQPSQTPGRVLLPLGLAVTFSLFGDLTLYAVLVTQLQVVALSLGAVGIMLGVNRLIRIPANPLGGMLLDRFGRRRLFVLGMLFGVASTLGYSEARGFWPFLFTRLLWGLAWTLINVGGLTMIVDITTPANRGRLTGMYNTWVLLGLGIGPLVGGYLVDTIGFRSAMLVNAAMGATGLLVALVAIPETRPLSQADPSTTDRADVSPRRLGDWRGPLRVLAGRSDLLAVVTLHAIVEFSALGVVLSTFSLLLQQRFGAGINLGGQFVGIATAAGFLLGVRALLAGAIGPVAGHVSDVWVGRWPVITGALILGVAAFGLLAFSYSFWPVVSGLALSAVSSGAALAILAALLGDMAPPGRQGIAMGAYATAGDIGAAAGPFLAFALINLMPLSWVYVLCAAFFLLGQGLLMWVQRREPTGQVARE
ncbi:MAG: MFS transporter [Caldilineae bacterium]|nr:MAG: MFS transporter [Caldilineae bacterium]